MFGYEGYHSEVLIPYDVLHPGDLDGGGGGQVIHVCTGVRVRVIAK